DGDGHAQDSHGWTSLIGAIMRHSDLAGRYQTMPDRALSTSARPLTSSATSDRGAAREWTKQSGGRTRGTAEARATHMRPRVIYDAKPGSPLEVARELYSRLARETGRRTLVDRFVVPRRTGRAWPVRAGQLFRIVAVEGPQVADLNVWGLSN